MTRRSLPGSRVCPAPPVSLVLAAASLLSVWACQPASTPATDSAGFFAGRTISYVVTSTPGGGYDTYARLIGKYMERQLPGTRVVVRNVVGAQNIVGTNEIYGAVPDGLTIGTFTIGLLYSQLVGEVGVRYDLGRMSWIGKASAEPRVLTIGTKTGLTSIEDLRRSSKPVRLATGPVGSSAYYATKMLAEALGIAITVVPGFDESEGLLAMVRGDVAGLLGSPTSSRTYVQQGHSRFVLRIGRGMDVDDALPAAEDLAVSPLGRSLVSLVATQAVLSRVTAGPPGIPADRLAHLRRAYTAALADPGLKAEAARLQFPIDPLDGAEVSRRVDTALHQPPEVMNWLRAASQR